MILYALTSKRRCLRQHFSQVWRGFTLFEIALVLLVIAIIASAIGPSASEMVIRTRIETERRSLGELTDAIVRSFENSDLTNLNIAALPGTIGPGDSPTEFSTDIGAYGTTNANSWFAKVARLRGLTPILGTPPTATAQPALAAIAYNALGNPRLLFAGPNEPGQQRFLMMSLMARSDQLALPAYDGSAAWFDAIWNNDWDSRTATLPVYWTNLLNRAQRNAWRQGSGGLTQAWRLCVRTIVLPKYTLTINNNHPTNFAFVSFNNTANAFTAAPNSGANPLPEILGGRLVAVNQGTAWPGVEALRFHLHSNDTVIVQ